MAIRDCSAFVGSMRNIGVTVASDLSVSAQWYVDALLNACRGGALLMPSICLGRTHGMPDQALNIVERATTITRTPYAGPAWCGYTNASDKGRIQRFLDRIF